MDWEMTRHKSPRQDGYRKTENGINFTIICRAEAEGPCVLSTHGSAYLGPFHFENISQAKAKADAIATADEATK